jgi:hypothetical protein
MQLIFCHVQMWEGNDEARMTNDEGMPKAK